MMIPKKPVGRRTLLRGLGTVMAMPLLEAMVASATAAEEAAAKRLLGDHHVVGVLLSVKGTL